MNVQMEPKSEGAVVGMGVTQITSGQDRICISLHKNYFALLSLTYNSES